MFVQSSAFLHEVYWLLDECGATRRAAAPCAGIVGRIDGGAGPQPAKAGK
jgi:hypothetical protein